MGDKNKYQKQWRKDNPEKVKQYNKNAKKRDRKEYMREWRLNNIKEIAIYRKQWKLDNTEYIKQYTKQYYSNHIEDRKRYNSNNREEIIARKRQWYLDNIGYNKWYYNNHKKEIIKNVNKYHQTSEGKTTMKKQSAKRRQLGFFTLNKYFKEAEAHHISEHLIIYIPKKIHQYMYHNIWTWKNMEQMNKIAFDYL